MDGFGVTQARGLIPNGPVSQEQSGNHVPQTDLSGPISFLGSRVTFVRELSSNISVPTQTVTRAAESDLEPGWHYNVLAKVSNIPKWAPVFADAIEHIDDVHYRVTKSGETFNLEVSLHPSAGAVDYI